MANSFSQMYEQIVFAVKGRDNFMAKSWRTEVYKYILNQEEHHKKRTFKE